MALQSSSPSHGFTSALLLAEREDLAAVDRRALREAGLRNITIVSSGCEAARLLANPNASGLHMVLCTEQLADMSGDDFVRLVRLHPHLLPFPLLVVVTSHSRQSETLARASGYSGWLTRPYTQQQLRDQLLRAAQCLHATKEAMKDAPSPDDTSAFETSLRRYEEAGQVSNANEGQQYRQGLVCVRQHSWDEGIALLQQVLKHNPHHGEALIALASAWRGKGNESKSRAMLREAVAVFVETETWDKALAVSERLMTDDPDAPSPLLEEAGRLVVGGKPEEAVQAMLTGRKLSSSSAVVEHLLRACLASADPEYAAKSVGHCLSERGEKELAVHLGTQFMTKFNAANTASNTAQDSAGTSGEAGTSFHFPLLRSSTKKQPKVRQTGSTTLNEPDSSLFAAFPVLRDAWNVAKVTASLFRMLK